MGENTHQNCTRQNKNKEDPGRQQPCWGFLFCTNLTQPTGNLDHENAIEIMKLLEQINRLGTTVVVITHSQEIVSKMGKRVIKLEKGQVVSDSRAEEQADS